MHRTASAENHGDRVAGFSSLGLIKGAPSVGASGFMVVSAFSVVGWRATLLWHGNLT